MNQKGILFTIMTLLMALSILALNTALLDLSRESGEMGEIISIISVGNRFRNIESMLIDLDKNGAAKEVAERSLPFSYTLDKENNFVSFAQEIPLTEASFEEPFNIMNMVEVFLEDTNTENVFDGIKAELDVPANSDWGGTDTQTEFVLNPFCYSYKAMSQETFSFSESTSEKCSGSFQQGSIERIDFNIIIKSGNDDFDSLECDGGLCPQDPYSPIDPFPYYSLTIDDNSCSQCSLPQKTASAHFDPSIDLNIVLSCTASCTSVPLKINYSSPGFNFLTSHEGTIPLEIQTKITFDDPPADFFVSDVNLTVRHPTTVGSQTNK